MAKEAEAKERADGKWEIKHEDGSTEVLTDKQFHARYDVDENGKQDEGEKPTAEATPETSVTSADGSTVGNVSHDEAPDTASKRNRPDTHDADDAFPEDTDLPKAYSEDVEAELDELEDGIKAVRSELKSVKSGKGGFGALRSAMHALAHGKSLLRTAHAAVVPHDGPERLRPAPSPEESISSGPSEETNIEAIRHFGR